MLTENPGIITSECIDLMREHLTRAAAFSDDPVTKVGAVLATARGRMIMMAANRFPSIAASKPELLEGDGRHRWLIHAEARLIAEAAFEGTATAGRHVWLTLPPCLPCANTLIAAGIRRIYVPSGAAPSGRYLLSCLDAEMALKNAGVALLWI